MTHKQLINKTVIFVKKKLGSDTTGHDWQHIQRVWKASVYLSSKEKGVNRFIVELAALLHDMDDWKFNKEGNTTSKTARIWLTKNNLDKKDIEHVCKIIESVSFKGANVKSTASTIEAKIVQDADRLDALGAIGITRAVVYGGYKGIPIYDPNLKPKLHKDFHDYKSSKSTIINHFYEKLLLLPKLINTKSAKKIAIKRAKYMNKFLEEFFGEYNLSDFKN